MSQKTVFISYRRDSTGKPFARSLKEALTKEGYDVFLDVDSLGAGPWPEQIQTRLRQSSHFLLLLTPGALDRCTNEDDWVRKECLMAKASGRNIVPIREESVSLSEMRKNCPDCLAWVFNQQIAELRHGSFEADIDRIISDYIPRHKAPPLPGAEDVIDPPPPPRFPPRRAEPFIGHKTQIPEVLALWEQYRLLAITGIGGLGKTGLAAEILASLPGRLFSHDYYQQPDPLAALTTIVSQTGTDPAGMNQVQMEALVTRELSQPDTRLYLEGCEQAKDILSLLHLTGSARVLLTTRDETTPDGVHGWPLPPLSTEDAAQLIAHLSGRPQAQVMDLASYLGGHALATRLAGNVLKNKLRTVSQLLESLRSDGLSALGTEEKQHRSVFFLLKEIATHLEEAHPGTAKVWYTLALGALSPLPLSLLRNMVNAPDEMLQAMQHEGILLAKEVPPESGDEPEPAVQLSHSLVQAFALQPQFEMSLNTATDDPSTCVTYDLVAHWQRCWQMYLVKDHQRGRFPGGWSRYTALLPQLEGLLARLREWDQFETNESLTTLCLVATVHCNAGRYSISELLWENAAHLFEKSFGVNNKDTLICLSNKAGLMLSQGKLEGAESLFEKVLAAQSNLLGSDDPDRLRTQSNLAELRRRRGDFAGALHLLQETLSLLAEKFEPDYPVTLQCLNNLALLLSQNDDWGAAEEIHYRVWAARLSNDPCNPETLGSLNNLGAVHEHWGRWTDARNDFALVVKIAQGIFAPDHPDRLGYEQNLARVEAKIRELGLE